MNKSVQIGENVVFEIVLHNTGKIALTNITVVESLFDGLTYVGFVDNTGMWINNGLSWILNDTLTPGEYTGFFVTFATASAGNFTNVVTAGNLTANDTVEVINSTVPDGSNATDVIPTENNVTDVIPPEDSVDVENKAILSKETGNPILLILLVLLNLVILRRRK